MAFSFLRSSFIKLPAHRKFRYVPRYKDPEEASKKKKRKTLRMERGAFYKNSSNKLLGAFKRESMGFRDRTDRSGQLLRMVFLSAMLGICVFFVLGKINGFVTFGILLILMLLFIRNVKSY